MNVICTKPEAATRQLDEAIRLLFADHDPLAIRTLAAAAHGVLADLVEHKLPGESWRAKIITDSGLQKGHALSAINSAQNYLKHADRDPEAKLSFEEEENDHVIFVATLECATLGYQLSFCMQVFQIWYLASYPDKIGVQTDLVKRASSAFSNLHEKPREARLHAGSKFMEEMSVQYGGELSFNKSRKVDVPVGPPLR